MRIAFVKQDVYQDLYVAGVNETAENLICSSIMRAGPIALFTLFNTDFYIIKEENTPECRAWEKVIPHYNKRWFRQLKTLPHSQTDFPEAKLFQSKRNASHASFSKSAYDVNWSVYDIVIGINFPIPRRIVEAHHNTLWCYMIGEANIFTKRIYHGYDVSLTQQTRGLIARDLGFVDFPYSFIGPTCIEEIAYGHLGRDSARTGVYLEVNSVRDLAGDRLLDLKQQWSQSAHPLRFHQQGILQNLCELYDSKYFVKAGGRMIRGNSVIEAISSGTLVLMDPAEVHHSQLLPKECWVYSADEAIKKINMLDKDNDKYEALLQEQRSRVQAFAIDAPMESLRNCLRVKRERPKPSIKNKGLRRFLSHLRRAATGDL